METNENSNVGGGVLSGYMVNTDPGYTQSFSPDGMGTPTPPKKKGPVLVIVLAIVGVVLVVGGILAFVFRGVLANSWARMTKSPEEYCRYVLEKNLGDADQIWKNYEDLYSQAASLKGIRISGETRLELSKEMISEIEDAYTDYQRNNYSYYGDYYDKYMDYVDEQWNQGNNDYLDYDEWVDSYDPGTDDDVPAIKLNALSDIALVYEFERNEDAAKAMQALQLADKEYLLSLDEIYDSDEQILYVRMPEINKDYAAVEMEEFMDEDELEMLSDVLFGSNRISSQMIEPKTLKSIYGRYLGVLVSRIDDVDEKNDKIKVSGETQKCVSLTFTIDEDMIRDTATEFLETMIDDEDLENVITGYVKANLPMEDPDDVWNEVVDELEQALEEIEDADIDTEAECTIYVSNTGKIIGVNFEDDDDNSFFFGYVVSKGKLFMEMTTCEDGDELMALEGVGKLSASGVTADFTLFVEELDKEFTFSLENLTPKGGVFTTELEQYFDVAEEEGMDEEIEGFADLLKDGTLRIERHSDGKKTDMSVAVMDGTEKMAAISWKMEVSDAEKIELPASRDTEKIADEMDLLEYLTDCDLGLFVDKLEELGLPEEDADDLREEIEWLSYY